MKVLNSPLFKSRLRGGRNLFSESGKVAERESVVLAEPKLFKEKKDHLSEEGRPRCC